MPGPPLLSARVRSTEAVTVLLEPVGLMRIPPPALPRAIESLMKTLLVVDGGSTSMPKPLKSLTVQLSICSVPPAVKLIPEVAVPWPSRSSPFNTTTSLEPALTVIALPLVTRMVATVPLATMEIALPIVTAPKSPESRTSISPPAAVCESAPEKVRHGALRVQALLSLPVADTQVWEARAQLAWAPVNSVKRDMIGRLSAYLLRFVDMPSP